MSRTHVSEQPGPIEVYGCEQLADSFPHLKPKGFWYEVDAGWRRWCEVERPNWVAGRYLHRVTLGDERMLVLASVAAFDAFVAESSVPTTTIDLGIEWNRVAERYDGIEIAPYHWGRRLEGPLWYYGWDCASGVIWRPRGVTVALLGPVEAAEAVA